MRPTIVSWLVAVASAFPTSARAEAARIRASIACEAPGGPGRFRCDVEVRSIQGRISWADVEVVAVDDLVLPLRGRAGPRDSSTHDTDIYRWSLGFVARARGTGTVRVRVRAVVCQETGCAPAETEVIGSVVVGH